MSGKYIKLLEGIEVLNLFKDSSFMKKFSDLYNGLENTTVFQSPTFLDTWYNTKLPEFTPLAVIGGYLDVLEGLMFLAIPKSPKNNNRNIVRIVGAGEYDAEYQTWIVTKNKEIEFLPWAFELIFKEFPKSKIIFRFIPEVNDLQWIIDNDVWKKHCVIQPYRRPLMQMSHPNFNSVYKKRHLKAKYNRFIKAGRTELIEILDRDKFEKVYEEIMLLYDFRQGALFNKIPSEKNVLRKPLFLSLFDNNILYVSVLKLNKEITSCIIGMKNKKWMHLSGLITYSPFYAKLSPGLVHLYLLGKSLKDQGFCYFDLTPGYDGYKERLATNSDVVFELTISKATQYKILRKLRKAFHGYLLSKNIRPMSFNLKLQKLKHRILNKTANFQWIFYSIKKDKSLTQELEKLPIEVEKNNLKHLLAYIDDFRYTRWEFLENAFSLVESGESFYTWTHNQKLMACIWTTNIKNSSFEKGNQNKCLNMKSIYLYPNVKDREKEFLEKVDGYILKNS